jgi:hypothetical protein
MGIETVIPRFQDLGVFAQCVAAYRATVRQIEEGVLPDAIADACRQHGLQTLEVLL